MNRQLLAQPFWFWRVPTLVCRRAPCTVGTASRGIMVRSSAAKSRGARAAKAQVEVPKGKKKGATLMEDIELQETEKAAVKRRRTRSFDEQVSKAISDNCKGMSEAQVNVNLIDGLSLRDRVADAKRRQQNGESITLGKSFYSNLREMYGGNGSPAQQMRIKDESGPEDQRMHECLLLMLRHNRDAKAIEHWLRHSDLCSQKNFVGCCRAFLLVPPSQSLSSAALVLEFARYVARTRANEVFAEEWGLMKKHVDSALQKSLAHMRGQGVPCSVWWNSVRDVGKLLLPEGDVDKVLGCNTTWESVREELRRVGAASPIGQKMFSSASRQLGENESSDLLQKEVTGLAGKDLTQTVIDKLEKNIIALFEGMGMDASATFPRRMVDFMYRGVSLRSPVHSLMDEFCLRKEAKIREIAVLSGSLDAMWCEDELAPQIPFTKAAVEDSLLSEVRRMRSLARDFLPTLEEQTGENIKECLKQKASVLHQIDRHSRIEQLFFEAHIGERAEKRMHECILSCLPCRIDDYMPTLADSRQSMKRLGEGRLYAFCGAGVQAVWSTVSSSLQVLNEGRCPAWHQAAHSPFWTSVQEACANFLKVHVPAVGDDAPENILYGAGAAKHMMAAFLQKKAANDKTNFKYGDLTTLLKFKWLLAKRDQDLVDSWVAETLSKPASSPTSAADSSAAGKKAKGKNKDLKNLVGGLFKNK